MFAEILKNRRSELGLTQENVAEKLFVSRQTVSNWENGKNFPDIPTLIAISDIYSLSLDYMLKEDKQFKKKIEDDYKLIKKRKDEQISSIVIVISIMSMVIICLVSTFFKSSVNDNFIALIVLLLCFPLLFSSYKLYKSLYSQEQNGPQSLFVPKAYGFGMSINPNHPVGKLLWVFISIAFLVLLIYTLFHFLI